MLFIDHTRRSASELLADLSACRQLRHISVAYRQRIIEETYLLMAQLWMEREAIKHPNPNNPCTNCGQLRSKFSYGPGLCYRCYACKGIEERDLWVEDVFWQAIHMRGFTCDACGKIKKPRDDKEARNVVSNMLDSMDGEVRPVLCLTCISDFKSFCSRSYGKASWRHAEKRDLEKMVLGWFAQKVKVAADRAKHREDGISRKRTLKPKPDAMQTFVLDWRS